MQIKREGYIMDVNILVISGSRAEVHMLNMLALECQKKENLKVNFTVMNLDRKIDFDDLIYMPDITFIDFRKINFKNGFNEINDKIKTYLENMNPDYIIVLGDRWEILITVFNAVIQNIPIIHLGGGEISNGSYDDIFRDWISRASQYHFVISNKAKKRLKQIGIKKNVFVVGSPRIDTLNRIILKDKTELFNELKLKTNKKTAIVLYHPATKSDEDPEELIDALKELALQYVIIRPNIDKGSRELIDRFSKLGELRELDLVDWTSLLFHADLMIGNSSAGVMEAPYFGLPFINVGERQAGREGSKTIKCEKEAIIKAVNKAKRYKSKKLIYVSRKIADILSRVL